MTDMKSWATMKRIWAGASVLLFTAVVLLYLWWGRFHYDHSRLLLLTYVVGCALVLSSHLVFSDNFKRLGLRLGNWRRAARVFGWITLPVVFFLCLLGWNRISEGVRFEEVLAYVGWAGLQQHLLQNFLRLRLEDLLGGDVARSSGPAPLVKVGSSLGAAVLFAGFHLPNMTLFLSTLIAGVVWCLAFSAVPSLPASWASHALLGSLLLVLFKPDLIGPLSVGSAGYRFEAYGNGVQVAAGYDESLAPFIATLPGPDRGQASAVRLFTPDGRLRMEWVAFPELDFSGRLAVGDLGLEPGDEIVVVPGPAPANPPRVRVFSVLGKLLAEFEAVDLPDGYGCSVSVGQGRILLSAGPGPGAPSRAVLFSGLGEGLRVWDFGDRVDFVNGLQALLRSSGGGELILWGTPISVNPSHFFHVREEGLVVVETLPTTYGANVTPVHFGGEWGIAVAPGPLRGYPPWIQLFAFEDGWKMVRDFVAFEDGDAAGANLAAVDLDGDGKDELVVGEGCAPGRPALVRIIDSRGRLLEQWNAY